MMLRMAAVTILAAVLIMGCQTMPWQKRPTQPPVVEPIDPSAPYIAPDVPGPGLQLSSEQRFKDIPLPTGMKEDMDRTFVFESSSLQVGRMVYTSRAPVFDLVNFFIKESPTAQWQLKDVMEAGGKTLVFTKPGKRLAVTVQNLGLAKGRRVTIILTPETGTVF